MRFIGVVGTSTSGELIGVVRSPPDGGSLAYSPTISNVLFRDIALTQSGTGGGSLDGVSVRDLYSTPGGIARIAFEAVVVVAANGGNALHVSAEPTSSRPITDIRWRGGQIVGTGSHQLVLLFNRVAGATFDGVRIENDATAGTQPVVALGPSAPCTDVVFADATLAGLRAGQAGISFGDATACGWSRGAMTGDAAAVPAAFGAASAGWFLTGADLATISPNATIAAGAKAFRIGDNHAGGQKSPLRLGAATGLTVTAGGAKPVSSLARLTSSDSSPLDTVNGGAQGDVLVLSAAAGTVSVKAKGASAGNLQLRGDRTLAGDDTLLLLRRPGTIWAELAGAPTAERPALERFSPMVHYGHRPSDARFAAGRFPPAAALPVGHDAFASRPPRRLARSRDRSVSATHHDRTPL